jgi:hypothetical protein
MTLTLHHYRWEFIKIEIEGDSEDACLAGVAEICRRLSWKLDDIWTEKGND